MTWAPAACAGLPAHRNTTVQPLVRQRLPKISACIDYWTQWLADLATPERPASR